MFICEALIFCITENILCFAGYSCLGCGWSCIWVWTSWSPLVRLLTLSLIVLLHFLSQLLISGKFVCNRGNILLSRNDSVTLHFLLEGKHMFVKTFGLSISIIDFTLSRINTGESFLLPSYVLCTEGQICLIQWDINMYYMNRWRHTLFGPIFGPLPL